MVVADDAKPADIAICAAAVADWRAADEATQKLKKQGESETVLKLAQNPDILATIAGLGQKRPRLVIGFAAETEDVVARARAKRDRKHVDVIVANDVSRDDAGFDVDSNAVTIVDANGTETVPRQSKAAVAAAILTHLERLFTWTATTSSNI